GSGSRSASRRTTASRRVIIPPRMNPPGETLSHPDRPPAAAPPPFQGRWKRPATAQLVQSFDGDRLVIEQWPEGRTRARVSAWTSGALGATLLIAALSVLLLGRPRALGNDWDLVLVVFVCWVLATALLIGLARRSWRDLVLA